MGEIWSGSRRVDTALIENRAAQAASALASLGIGQGDALAIVMRNDFPFFEATFAIDMLGGYAVPMNWHLTAEELAHIFRDCQAKAIVAHADFLDTVRKAAPEGVPVFAVETPAEVLRAYGIADEAGQIPAGAVKWGNWIEGFSPLKRPAHRRSALSMIYTSGTTGRPKGVRRLPPTPDQAEAAARRFALGFGFRPGELTQGRVVTVITGPMYHSLPNTFGIAAFQKADLIILQPRFDEVGLLRTIEEQKVTHLHPVPIMFNRLLKLPEEIRARYDISSLRFVAHAAAPVSPHIKRDMIRWFGPIIHEYYGSTEVPMVTYCDTEQWLAHPGTVGRPLDDAEIRILDPEGRELPTGEVGEIFCRVKSMSGFAYYGQEGLAQKTERNGLYSVGDVGFFDKDGFLYLSDRAKDIVISGGVNIYTAEIEGELHKMDGIVDCAVFGIPNEEYGEALCAVVQRKPGVSLSAADIQNHLRKYLAGYKIPRTIEFRDDLPREDSGKIFKRRLRDAYWAGSGRNI